MLLNDLREEIDALQQRHATALDTKDLAAWLDCFSSDGGYVCTTAENFNASLPIAIMMDDSPERLKDRVKYIEKIWSGTFEDYSTRHFSQRMTMNREDSTVQAETNFLVSYVATNGTSGLLATGVYRDEIVLTSAGPRFRRKVAVIDASVTPRYLVYPV